MQTLENYVENSTREKQQSKERKRDSTKSKKLQGILNTQLQI